MRLTKKEISNLEQKTEALRKKLSFESYALTLRKIPTDKLYEQYLQDLGEMDPQHTIITSREKKSVEARKIWSDFVAETYQANQVMSTELDIKGNVIARLRSLGASNPEASYQDCMNYLRDNSVITITFGNISMRNFTDFQALNLYERGPLSKGQYYQTIRNRCEEDLAQALSPSLKTSFLANLQARPRYGAMQFIGPDDVTPTDGYGRSFIVLKDVVKLNAIFVPGDSLNYYNASGNQNYQVCTIHHLEFLLLQCPTHTLQKIMLQMYVSMNTFDYLEVMLPAINLFDPNLVEHIYLDSNYYALSPEELETLARLGIKVSNISNPTHNPLRCAISQGDMANVKDIIETFKKDLNRIPWLLPLASESGHLEIVTYLLNQSVYVDQLDHHQKSALMHAVYHGKLDIVLVLLAHRADIRLKNKQGENAIDIAVKRSPEILETLLCYFLTNELPPKKILTDTLKRHIKKIVSQGIQPGEEGRALAFFLLELAQKRNELSKKPEHASAWRAADHLYQELKTSFEIYQQSEKNKASWDILLQTWTPEIKSAKQSALAEHRGWIKNFLANVALFLTTAGIGYLVLRGIQEYKSPTKHLFFQTKTASANLIDNVEKNLKNISPYH